MQYQQQNPYQGQPGSPPQHQQPPSGYAQPGYQQQGYAPPQQPYAQPGYPQQQPMYTAGYATPFPVIGGVRVPMLISAICNALMILWWLSTILLSFIAVLPLILMIFEFVTFSKLNGRNPPWQHKGAAIAIGILEILSAGYLNGLSWICGIIVLCNVGRLSAPAGYAR